MVGRPRAWTPPEHCTGCSHHGHKDRSPTALRGGPLTGKLTDTPDRLKECLWFQTADGRAASADERKDVIVASVNGGRCCPVRSAD